MYITFLTDENDGAQSIYSVNENNHMIEYISASNSGIESRREREPRSTTIMLNQVYYCMFCEKVGAIKTKKKKLTFFRKKTFVNNREMYTCIIAL